MRQQWKVSYLVNMCISRVMSGTCTDTNGVRFLSVLVLLGLRHCLGKFPHFGHVCVWVPLWAKIAIDIKRADPSGSITIPLQRQPGVIHPNFMQFSGTYFWLAVTRMHSFSAGLIGKQNCAMFTELDSKADKENWEIWTVIVIGRSPLVHPKLGVSPYFDSYPALWMFCVCSLFARV